MYKQIQQTFVLLVSCLLLPFAVWAQGHDDIFSEEDIFSEPPQVEQTQEDASSDVTKAITEQSLSFSGNIEAKGNMYVSRDTFEGDEDFGDNTFASTVTGEFYYNGAGYDDDMLGNDATRDQFLQGGYFQPNNYGKYYAAAFTSFGRFLVSDVTLNVNAIGNLSDSSGQLSVGVDYLLTFNATLSAKLETYLIPENHEYTLDGNTLNTEAKLNIVF